MTEAVTWISGGAHVQYSFFSLGSFLAYLLATKEKKYYLLSLAFFVLALLSSEKAVVLPAILLAYEVSNKSISKNWKGLIAPFLLGGSWAAVSAAGITQRVQTLQTSFYQKPSTLNPLTQIPIAITSYLELIFWPKNLTLYHSEMIFTQTEYLIRLGIFLAFLGSIVYTYRRQRQVFFWLSFFIISLLPTLTPFGISWIVAERYVYLGAIGIFVVVALVFNQLWKNEKLRPGVRILFSLIILALLTRTIVRNVDWKDQDTLWLATAKTSPSSSQNHNNLGDYYGRQGDFEKAIEEFKRAIELNPNYAGAYHNLANTYRQLGKTDWAIENYQKAAELNPNLWQSHQNLAVSYFDRGQLDLAEENMKKAIEVNPENANLYLNLGIIYLRMEDGPRAEEAFQKARELDPQIQTPPTQP
ncbi:tetratricopeptide repeat protein, partial [Candidatus Parcubacteria bacterium]|nr:tetratricopeptide repeat protein [Candidatus Parcubacteria bacterium]